MPPPDVPVSLPRSLPPRSHDSAGQPAAVDVVVPVFNAPEATRRCLESLYKHAGSHLARVLVWDDASDAATARMLDGLSLPRLSIVHAPRNAGFGAAVNQGMALVRTDLALVLNSDIEVRDDFLAPLLEAIRCDTELAALQANCPQLASYDLRRYRRR